MENEDAGDDDGASATDNRHVGVWPVRHLHADRLKVVIDLVERPDGPTGAGTLVRAAAELDDTCVRAEVEPGDAA